MGAETHTVSGSRNGFYTKIARAETFASELWEQKSYHGTYVNFYIWIMGAKTIL